MNDLMIGGVYFSEMCRAIEGSFIVQGPTNNIFLDNIATPPLATATSLIFISSSRKDKQELLENTRARVIICDESLSITSYVDKTFIIVQNPKFTFAKLSQIFFSNVPKYEIHPTATIHPDAMIEPNVYIGPYCYIGKCKIKSGSVIHGKTYLYDNVEIGEQVMIQAGCIIGADGCGHIKGYDGRYQVFPHIGKVIIESNVQIGPNVSIAKGALSDTIIKSGAIIDSFVQIGHNVLIEENVMILSNSVVGGSSVIKKNVLLAIGAHVCDYVIVGENAHIGPGVVIMVDVAPNSKVLPRAPLILSQ